MKRPDAKEFDKFVDETSGESDNRIGFEIDVGYRMYNGTYGSLHTYLEPFVGIGTRTRATSS